MKPRETPEVEVKVSQRPKLRVTIRRAYSQKTSSVPRDEMTASTPDIDAVKRLTDPAMSVDNIMQPRDNNVPHCTPTCVRSKQNRSRTLPLRRLPKNTETDSEKPVNCSTQTNQPGSPWLEDYQTPVYPSPAVTI